MAERFLAILASFAFLLSGLSGQDFRRSDDPTSSSEPGHFSTCPDLEHAVVRSVVYVQTAETELRGWATAKVSPKKTNHLETVHIQVQVEGDRAFCAQATDGPSDKGKAAVDAAMQWRFKKRRGEFRDNLVGTLTFRF